MPDPSARCANVRSGPGGHHRGWPASRRSSIRVSTAAWVNGVKPRGSGSAAQCAAPGSADATDRAGLGSHCAATRLEIVLAAIGRRLGPRPTERTAIRPPRGRRRPRRPRHRHRHFTSYQSPAPGALRSWRIGLTSSNFLGPVTAANTVESPLEPTRPTGARRLSPTSAPEGCKGCIAASDERRARAATGPIPLCTTCRRRSAQEGIAT